MKEELKREIAAEAAKVIFANEGNYSSVNADDNGALSVGKVQWHGNRALSLLKEIAKRESGRGRSFKACRKRRSTESRGSRESNTCLYSCGGTC